MLAIQSLIKLQVFTRLLGAVVFGAFSSLAFAPYSFWPAMLISLISLFLLIHQQKPKFATAIGFSWGLGQFATGIGWIYVVIKQFGGLPTSVGLLLIGLLIAYLALFPALFSYVLRRIQLPLALSYLLMAPSLWLVIDWFRGWFLTGFPWLWPGYSQIDGPLAGFAPLFGVQGITLAILIISASIALTILSRKLLALLPTVIVAIFGYVSGNIQWVQETGNTVNVAMVQGNIPQELKWLPSQRWTTLFSYQDMTRKNWDADIIIWPEAAIPEIERNLSSFLISLDDAAHNNDTALIVGILDRDPKGHLFNKVIILGKNGTEGYSYPAPQSYTKHHLLMFGEYMPFSDNLRTLAPLFNLPMSSFSRGNYAQPNINANGYKLVPAICYEIAFNEQVRHNLTPDSDFILTLSNDTWFGTSIGPHQHLEIARMRALENGKPVLRATNTGLTAAIDYKGKLIEQIMQFETVVLRANITTTDGQTPYTYFGNWLLYFWIVLSGLSILILQQTKTIRLQLNHKGKSKYRA
ncbi:apolipoprotein N-acyltransferase [Candidatus Enterovibrio escicola]|uniref:Apolipoprotein N-acyltransferase n=1 Tax=Candidatus Enterovibrio escicola TaxID=1927127 RepID=A0A2A5SZL1_9GAMM|nr:apolipoprotein N-acyltransferase [Candidatus Enterovibrio escacola]PCS21342.1 Apolipoprotein N-acyltransferase [Candidatus Enterovibrio escacola]